MKVIIAGSRENVYYHDLLNALIAAKFDITEVVSGGAKGADTYGEQYAAVMKLPMKQFLPYWSIYGKSAGYYRNEEMAKYAEALIAVWDGESKGTKYMIDIARKAHLKVYVYNIKEQ